MRNKISSLGLQLHIHTNINYIISLVVVAFFASILSGCASGPAEQGYLYYPSLPNPPRIQHLHTFSNENDVKGALGGFGRFILGGSENDSSISKPYGLAVHEGKIYVVDTDTGGYAIFDLIEEDFNFIIGSGGGALVKPINIEIDEDGTKYITDTKRMQIVVFDQDDNYLRSFGVEGQFKPSDVALDRDRLYVADLLDSKIHVLDKSSGETLFTFPPKDKSSPAHLAHPTNITLHDGYIYVADSTQAQVNKYTTSGEYVTTIGQMGTNIGQFARPKGVAIDNVGNIYVVDAAFENVQIFSSDGELLLFFGESGYERRNINLPTTVVIDYDNNAYFQQYVAPDFKIEYVILVASQYGKGKVNAFGFGKKEGMDYSLTR
ncbi:MAG: 6-bladed beta-propeller [Candidatus Thiodiazotropha sp.]